MAARTRQFGYVRLALAGIVLAPFSWAMIASAQQEEEATPPPAPTTTEDAISREMQLQQQRHEERLGELQALRDRIAAETSDEAKADVQRLDKLIAEERRDHAARRAALEMIVVAVPEPGPARVRNAVNEEWNDLANAVRSLNQSYVVAPVVSNYAASGGSFYIDRGVTTQVVDPRVGSAPAFVPNTTGRCGNRVGAIHLPPPLFLGSGCGIGSVGMLPWWLYGGYGCLPVNCCPLNCGPTVLSRDSLCDEEVVRLRQTVRELTRDVEELRGRLPDPNTP